MITLSFPDAVQFIYTIKTPCHRLHRPKHTGRFQRMCPERGIQTPENTLYDIQPVNLG